ncbi:MAG: FKBP-type peptidyl-prolyl cis-trans isomerase [Fibromonadaceae bacterium]|jgi:peptidylprolyl isomerase|nr:FKBP-type peptidyl-prolyl cis-trans isomerase [Fibromonadaceae bacterium]
MNFFFLLILCLVKLSMAQNVDIKIVKEGEGEPARARQLVQVHYTGWLLDSTRFDSSRDRGEPLEFVLGMGQVIRGWDIGVEGMKLGEIRNLRIPSGLAYGNEAIGPIPANSDLLFEVELVGVQKSLEADVLLNPETLKWKGLHPGLEVFEEKEGNGAELRSGMELTFHYTGWLSNGHKFGSSKDLGKPAKTILGTGKLVKGLELGLEAIKEGGVRWFRLSPSMAYGPVAMTSIPPNSTLIFRIQADAVYFDEKLAASMDFFPNAQNIEWIEAQEGLKYYIEKEGAGEPVQTGSVIRAHYTGWLSDGTKFDSSRDRGEPIALELGAGRVIRGWDLGLAGMKPGEKRLLLIPPNLGYGSTGGGPIPPNATLIFAVELMN